MFLDRDRIKTCVRNRKILIDPFNEEMLKSGSYSFTLGNWYKGIYLEQKHDSIDARKKHQAFHDFEFGPNGILLRPGHFIICRTAEKLTLSKDVGCFLTMRGAKAQIGLDFLNGEIFCEPGSTGGWNGHLMLETTNRGSYPIELHPGIPIIKAIFCSFEL